jgi:hypothetical protein
VELEWDGVTRKRGTERGATGSRGPRDECVRITVLGMMFAFVCNVYVFIQLFDLNERVYVVVFDRSLEGVRVFVVDNMLGEAVFFIRISSGNLGIFVTFTQFFPFPSFNRCGNTFPRVHHLH